MQRGGSFFVRLAAGLLLLTKSLCSSGEDTVVPAHGFIQEGFNPWFVLRILLQCVSVSQSPQEDRPSSQSGSLVHWDVLMDPLCCSHSRTDYPMLVFILYRDYL